MALVAYTGKEWSDIRAFFHSHEGIFVTRLKSWRGSLANCTLDDLSRVIATLAPEAPPGIRGLLTVAEMMYEDNISRMTEYWDELRSRHPEASVGISTDDDETKGELADEIPSISGYAGTVLKERAIIEAPLYVNGTGTEPYYHKTERIRGGKGVHRGRKSRDVSTLIYTQQEGRYYFVASAVHAGGGGDTAVYRVTEVVTGSTLKKGDILMPKSKKRRH